MGRWVTVAAPAPDFFIYIFLGGGKMGERYISGAKVKNARDAAQAKCASFELKRRLNMRF